MNIKKAFAGIQHVALVSLMAAAAPNAYAARAHAGITDIYGGPLSNSTCVRLADQQIQCWGDLFTGVTQLRTPGTVVDIAMGDDFLCVLTNDGRVACAGDDTLGQLGGGAAGGSSGETFFAVQQSDFSYLQNVTQITAGGSHACALKSDHTVWCWGNNSNGQLGNFNVTAFIQPSAVQVVINDDAHHVLGSVDWITAGGNHTCAEFLPDAHGVTTGACWGYNAYGQLGSGTITPAERSPVTILVDGGSGPEALGMSPRTLKAGSRHTCAMIGDTAACWGDNNRGATSTGMGGNSPTPATVIISDGTTVTNITELSVGNGFSCLVFSNTTGACWGADERGQLGNYLKDLHDASSPIGVVLVGGSEITGFLDLRSNNTHTCALMQNKKVYCWGDNQYHQLGFYPYPYSDVPIETGDGPIFTDDFQGG